VAVSERDEKPLALPSSDVLNEVINNYGLYLPIRTVRALQSVTRKTYLNSLNKNLRDLASKCPKPILTLSRSLLLAHPHLAKRNRLKPHYLLQPFINGRHFEQWWFPGIVPSTTD
jgi:hypothetical protein